MDREEKELRHEANVQAQWANELALVRNQILKENNEFIDAMKKMLADLVKKPEVADAETEPEKGN